jgi:hypothetical protein|tara:strand:+ start:401 stop:865 length:465 start_codon:yes stop_codon:yes gene_type:complete
MKKNLFIILFSMFILYSCAEMYGTPQERSIKNSRMTDYGLCEKLGVGVLAPEVIREEWAREIQNRKINCNQYANAINNKRMASQQMMNQGLTLMQQSQPYTLDGNTPNSNSNVLGSAVYQRSYVSGMNRICIYDNMGSDYTTTIGATELCPLNP